MRTRVARASKNCDDRSLALYSIFFRSLVTALGGRSELPGGARSSEAQARLGHLLPHLPHEGGAMPSRGGKNPLAGRRATLKCGRETGA